MHPRKLISKHCCVCVLLSIMCLRSLAGDLIADNVSIRTLSIDPATSIDGVTMSQPNEFTFQQMFDRSSANWLWKAASRTQLRLTGSDVLDPALELLKADGVSVGARLASDSSYLLGGKFGVGQIPSFKFDVRARMRLLPENRSEDTSGYGGSVSQYGAITRLIDIDGVHTLRQELSRGVANWVWAIGDEADGWATPYYRPFMQFSANWSSGAELTLLRVGSGTPPAIKFKPDGHSFFGGSTARLGIGTDAPKEMLDVVGAVKAERIIVEAGNFTAEGDARTGDYVLRNITTDAVQKELFVNGSNARLLIPSGATWTFAILVSGHGISSGSIGVEIKGVVVNRGGLTQFVGSPINTVLGVDPSFADCNVTVIANDVNDSLDVRVVGIAGQPIRWVSAVRTCEVRQ